jgi:hypothetical protein
MQETEAVSEPDPDRAGVLEYQTEIKAAMIDLISGQNGEQMCNVRRQMKILRAKRHAQDQKHRWK